MEAHEVLAPPTTPPGCSTYISRVGVRVLRIHYSADPEKDAAWVAKVSAGYPKAEWRREYEMDATVYDGQPVFPDFSEPIHCPPILLKNSWVPRPGSRYILGVDCGQTLWPAACLIEVGPAPDFQIAVMLEVVSNGGEPMQTFAPRVLQELTKRFPGFWPDIQWVGDRTVMQRSGGTGESAYQVARKFGVSIKPMSNNIQGRIGAVTWALNDWITEDTPRMYVCGKDCPTLLQGFRGAYRFREWQTGDGRDRDLKDPLKDRFSHVQDALQYALVEAKALISGQGLRVHRAKFSPWQTPSPSLTFPPYGQS